MIGTLSLLLLLLTTTGYNNYSFCFIGIFPNAPDPPDPKSGICPDFPGCLARRTAEAANKQPRGTAHGMCFDV